jgi:metal-responsive CopG/Arc/MetJ family transcriptional regulator
MKTKTSVTLSSDVLKAVDELAGDGGNRSAVIERVLRAYFHRRARVAADRRELERLNRAAERLNREAADVLTYQANWPTE